MPTKPTQDAIKRRNHAVSLIMQWCNTHRPDIFKMAYDEAAKKYPYKRPGSKVTIELPASMRNAK